MRDGLSYSLIGVLLFAPSACGSVSGSSADASAGGGGIDGSARDDGGGGSEIDGGGTGEEADAGVPVTVELLSGGAESAYDGSSNPIDPFYALKKHQYLYLASDLTAAGIPGGAGIEAVGIKVAEAVPAPGLIGFRVAILQTDATTLDGFVAEDPLPEVLYGPSDLAEDTFNVDAWTTFELSETATWDGSSHLVVELSLDDQDDQASNGGGLYQRATGAESGRHAAGYTHTVDQAYPFSGLDPNIDDGQVASLQITYVE